MTMAGAISTAYWIIEGPGTTGAPVERGITYFYLLLYATEAVLGLLGCAALIRFDTLLLKLWFLCAWGWHLHCGLHSPV